MDARQIDTRLEAVESLNAGVTVRDQFILNLTKLPDLERMMSRTHAGTCEVQDIPFAYSTVLSKSIIQ